VCAQSRSCVVHRNTRTLSQQPLNAASGPDLLDTGRIYAQNVARQEDLCIPIPLREPGLASLSPPL
jgi:hypothetical protein